MYNCDIITANMRYMYEPYEFWARIFWTKYFGGCWTPYGSFYTSTM